MKQKPIKRDPPPAPDVEPQDQALVLGPVLNTALEEITRAEIDTQVATAKRYPRNLTAFRQNAMSMATNDKEVAASCFYKLKRTDRFGKPVFIEGPSVRLAEIVASAWGNLRFGARIIRETEKEVVAQGVAHDLQNNVCNTIEISRRITTKEGKRFGDDMVQVTKNAACSIALRNAIFKTVPFVYAKKIYEKAKNVAVGSDKTLAERRSTMIAEFKKMGVEQAQLLAYVEKTSFEDIDLTDIETLIGAFNAIRDGDTTRDELFNPKKLKPHTEVPQEKKQKPQLGPTGLAPISAEQITVIKDLSVKIKVPVAKTLVNYGCEKLEELTFTQAQEAIKILTSLWKA